jgi:levansucrase
MLTHHRTTARARVLTRLVLLVLLALVGAVLPAAAGSAAADRPHERGWHSPWWPDDPEYSPEDDFTANWTRAQALRIAPDETNTKPRIPEDFPVMTDEVWVWDTWPLTDLDMRPVKYRGWNVIFSLTAPRNIAFGDRHWSARIGYFYSRDGQDWTYGGDLFPAGESFGCREWAGSAVLTGRRQVHQFYTASGNENGTCESTDALQRLAHAAGRIYADEDGVFFRGFRDHEIVAEADGEIYQTLEQSQAGPIIYAFRDPFVFRDPADHRIYALFEGNNAGVAGTHTCDPHEVGRVPAGHQVPADARFYTGNIGLARVRGADMTRWELLAPVLSAECTNQQTERPHLVVRHGRYYLWTISHMFTFAPGLTGPDGLYGFVGDSLRSDYRAMNGSGLVLGNPEEAPLQNYSDYVMPNLLVESFIDTVPTANGGVRFGGTLAPTLQLQLRGSRSRLVDELDYGYIPAMVRRR